MTNFEKKLDIAADKLIDKVFDQPTKRVTLKPRHINYHEPTDQQMEQYQGNFHKWLESRGFNTD